MNEKNLASEITWYPDIKDWNKVSEKTAQFILVQSENILKETLETNKGVSAKTDKLISIYTPLITLLIVYFFNLISTNKALNLVISFLPLTAILSIIIIALSIYFCLKNFFKYYVSILGEYPKNMLRSDLIDEYEGEGQYINLVLNLCQNLQYRIDSNRTVNNQRIRNNDISLRILIIGLPCCPVISYLSLLLLDYLKSF